MNLKDVFDQFAYGELSQIVTADESHGGGVGTEHYRKLGFHVQLALTALHKRFLLKEGKVHLLPIPGESTYKLHSDFIIQESEEEHPEGEEEQPRTTYIKEDKNRPFVDDILKIERVYDYRGNELILNDLDFSLSLHTPSHDLLVIPEDYQHSQLTLYYRANHADITRRIYTERVDNIELTLPETHLEALLYYVASRMLNPVGISQEFHQGNNYYAKYEKACQRLEMENYQRDQVSRANKFERNGWV